VRLVRSVPGVHSVHAPGEAMPPCDCHAALMSLPSTLGTTPETIPAPVPYLVPDATLVEEWRKRLEADHSKLKVGLVWGGNKKPTPSRTMPLAQLAPFARVPGVSF
jgi:hypothetical protein